MTHSLHFAQVSATALMRGVNPAVVGDLFAQDRLATPFLLLSRAEIRRNYEGLKAALPRADIHYAVKSNNNQVILDELRSQGGSFDICSAAEIDAALAAGAPLSGLVHTHPVKSVEEFDAAVARGVEVFVVDNPSEVAKFTRYTERRLKVLVRFRVQVDTPAVVNLQYKFGCSPSEVRPLAQMIRAAGHDYHGLCFHIGSQCAHAENYLKAIATASDLIKELAEAGLPTRLLDIGGGFPAQYVEPVPEIEALCAPINETLDRLIPAEIRVICEPGRFISASPVTLVSSVIGKAERDGKMWYYLDDGLYSTFSGIVFDHCKYPVVTNRPGAGRLSVLAGPTCDSFDVMYDGLMIPEHEIGDKIVFPMTGAYCAVSASDFNSLRRPEYVVID